VCKGERERASPSVMRESLAFCDEREEGVREEEEAARRREEEEAEEGGDGDR